MTLSPQPERTVQTETPAASTAFPASVVAETTNFLRALGVPGQVVCRDHRHGDEPHVWVEILTHDSSLLIGRQGRTLDALEHVLRLLLRPLANSNVRILVDVNAYRVRRREVLQQRARLAAEQVRRTGRSVLLEFMRPEDRRTVHLTLAVDGLISTESQGQGPSRRVLVRLKDPRAG